MYGETHRLAFEIKLANVGNTSTFVTSRAESIINLTLTSLNRGLIERWKVHLEDHFSDHTMISFLYSCRRGDCKGEKEIGI